MKVFKIASNVFIIVSLIVSCILIFTKEEYEVLRSNIQLIREIDLSQPDKIIYKLDDSNWKDNVQGDISISFDRVNDYPPISRDQLPLKLNLTAYAFFNDGVKSNRLINNWFYSINDPLVNNKERSHNSKKVEFVLGRFDFYSFEELFIEIEILVTDKKLNDYNPTILFSGDGYKSFYGWFSIYTKFIIVSMLLISIVLIILQNILPSKKKRNDSS